MLTYFYVYLVLAIVPLWFLTYSAVRVARHWNDGKDKFILLNKHVYFKWLLSFLMILLTAMHIVDLAVFTRFLILDTLSRSLFFSLLLVSWVVSFSMGIFENNKRLMMRWSGHRSFWPANMIVHIILMIGDGIYFFNAVFSLQWLLFLETVYLFEILICIILTIYAIRRPNEFLIVNDMHFTFLRRSTRKTIMGSSNLESAELPKVSIKSYKIKQEEGKSTIYFNLTSVIKSNTFTSKRTLQEFDTLNKHLIDSFPQSAYPNLKIPSLTLLPSQGLEEKVSILNEYLSGFSLPEFFSQFSLDFLGISGSSRAILLRQYEEIMKNEEKVERSEFRSNSVIEKYYNPTSSSTDDTQDDDFDHHYSNFIDIKLPRWLEVSDHIEFEIIWTSNSSLSGTCTKRYKDILEFHNSLCKQVAPAKLPQFPSKNYLKKLSIVDEKALNLRKAKLEAYLNHVFNDVAFLTAESLNFLEFPLSLDKIWLFCLNHAEVRTLGRFIVSPVIDDHGHHLVYDIRLAKYQDKSKKNEWSISRRYRQFDNMHDFLVKRAQSPVLLRFNEAFSVKDASFPCLPGKSMSPILSLTEINSRRVGLERYLEELMSLPGLMNAYMFRQFIQDPGTGETLKIN